MSYNKAFGCFLSGDCEPSQQLVGAAFVWAYNQLLRSWHPHLWILLTAFVAIHKRHRSHARQYCSLERCEMGLREVAGMKKEVDVVDAGSRECLRPKRRGASESH